MKIESLGQKSATSYKIILAIDVYDEVGMLTFSFKKFLLGLRLFGDAALLVVGEGNNFGLELIPNMLSSIFNLNDI